MLILFDIDGTLLVTKGEGVGAMLDAGREMFGPQFHMDGVEFSGRLDPLIWLDLAQCNGINDPKSHHDRFRKTYHRILTEKLRNGEKCELLPGILEITSQLASTDGVTLGLLTGNYPETGKMKIERAGLDPGIFSIAAWGCDGESRRDLPPVAMEQYKIVKGMAVRSEQVVVIGDTPNDVDCAKAHGCRSIAVATGKFSVDELQAAGGDLVVSDLTKIDQLLSWIQTRPGA